MARIVAIIQARMGSTRLPGKVLRSLAGRPMLQRVAERVQRATNIAEVVVATSDLAEDDALVAACGPLGLRVVRGSATDVLARFHKAVEESRPDVVVRITADCPLISPMVTARVVESFLAGGCDYASNCFPRTFPRGLDTEVLAAETIRLCHREAKDLPEREHVTPFVYRHPERFTLRNVADPKDRSAWRWTVDTPEDFALLERMYEHLGGESHDYADAIQLIEAHPEWADLNRHIEQKKL
jgi:spore coat polysaccharide biosynthesis protein SpsF